jgi:hypothetical protein
VYRGNSSFQPCPGLLYVILRKVRFAYRGHALESFNKWSRNQSCECKCRLPPNISHSQNSNAVPTNKNIHFSFISTIFGDGNFMTNPGSPLYCIDGVSPWSSILVRMPLSWLVAKVRERLLAGAKLPPAARADSYCPAGPPIVLDDAADDDSAYDNAPTEVEANSVPDPDDVEDIGSLLLRRARFDCDASPRRSCCCEVPPTANNGWLLYATGTRGCCVPDDERSRRFKDSSAKANYCHRLKSEELRSGPRRDRRDTYELAVLSWAWRMQLVMRLTNTVGLCD